MYGSNIVISVIEIYKVFEICFGKKQTKHSASNGITFHRSVNPLANELISIADDFDKTPECFKEYI